MKQNLNPRATPISPIRPHVVEQAIAEIRRGDFVLLRDRDMLALAAAAESADAALLARAGILTALPARLATTHRRAIALGFVAADSAAGPIVELQPEPGDLAGILRQLGDPTALAPAGGQKIRPGVTAGSDLARAAIELARFARVLPAMVLFPVTTALAEAVIAREGIVDLDVARIAAHGTRLARSLRQVAEARVPLADAESSRVLAFRPDDGGADHLAILIGDPQPPGPILTRVHSECFTGDLLGSLRCDCGDQLRGAIQAIAEAGSGILIYLAQEGRGIGLVNKLRAYALQDGGMDTVDANLQLGFDADERIYEPAAQILRHLGFDKVRLMTNNPDKIAALAQCGIEVTERVAHIFPDNDHNRAYLQTKAAKSGHIL